MRQINKIFVHCSATKPTQNIGVDEIRKMHTDRGWSDIGYHYVIKRDDTIQVGRPVEKKGAHAKGHNSDSIGICLVGGIDKDGKPDANFTIGQYLSLIQLLTRLKIEYELTDEDIYGHRDVSSKACPCFDIHELLK